MSLCSQCGGSLSGDDVARGVCAWHPIAFGDDWHVSNRIMCDFLHRKRVPPRLASSDRDEVFFWTGDAA